MGTNDDIAIKVEGVSKTFKLPHEKNTSIKGALVNIGKRKKGFEKQHVLDDVSFEIKKGEFFGIVGRNGSGKSTLLKLLAGIYTPDKGSIQVNGTLTPFIELGVGFNPELTGRENVFLNGALLGFSHKQMEAMYDDIVSFAELSRFMDQKLKNYSSGMQVRLAFSIAIRANTDILLIDEVLAVGDANFQRKCYDFFGDIVRQKDKTVVFVSHDMDSVKKFCRNAVLVDKGKIVKVGSSSRVADHYTALNLEQAAGEIEKENEKQSEKTIKKESKEVAIESLWATSGSPKKKTTFKTNEPIRINVELLVKEKINSPVVGINFVNQAGVTIFVSNTRHHKTSKEVFLPGKVRIQCEVENVFTDDTYYVALAVGSADNQVPFLVAKDALKFVVSGREKSIRHGLVHPKHVLTVD